MPFETGQSHAPTAPIQQELPPIFQDLSPPLSTDDDNTLRRTYLTLPESISTRVNALPAHDLSGPHLADLILGLKRNEYARFRLHHVVDLYVPGGPRAELIDALCTTVGNTSHEYGHGIDMDDLTVNPASQRRLRLIAQALQIIDEATPEHNPLVITVHYDENLHLSNSVLGHTYEHMIRFPGQAKLIAQGWVLAHTG